MKYGMVHIAVGDMLRIEIAEETLFRDMYLSEDFKVVLRFYEV